VHLYVVPSGHRHPLLMPHKLVVSVHCLIVFVCSDGNENGNADTTGILTGEYTRKADYWFVTWEGKQANRFYYRWATFLLPPQKGRDSYMYTMLAR
jgi:hypothetical protein